MKSSPLPYAIEVRRFVVGGLLFVLFLAGVSLLGLWSTTEWAVSSSLRRYEAETRAAGEVVRRSSYPSERLFSDPPVLDRLRALGALQGAIFDSGGSLLSQAEFLPWSPVLPDRLDRGSLPPGLSPLARLTSLQGVGAIAVTLPLPERRAFLWIVFDGTGAFAARRTVNILATVVPAGAVLLLALVAPFLRRLLRPMEGLTETAFAAGPLVKPAALHAAEPEAAVEIFRRTVEELRLRTSELESLRQAEKERADALAVTAETLVRSHPGGVLVVNAAGRLTDANGPALASLELDRSSIGREAREVLSVCAPVQEAVLRAAGGDPTLAREVVRGDLGAARCLAVTAVPVADASGKALGTLVFLEDRTAQARLEAELSRERQMAALGEMSAGIAHEFRNSTATILGWTRLAEATDDPGERRAQLSRIREEAQHVANVTGDFLLFARPDRLVLEKSDLDSLVAEAVAEVRLAKDEITFTIEGGLGEATVDAGLLRRALVNLLRNAREAAGLQPGSVVRVGGERMTGPDGGAGGGGRASVRIVVEDSGPGIPPEAVPRLFVPFSSAKAGGTGLGLSLVAKIVALHGGSVSVDRSRDLGGASIALAFPAEPPLERTDDVTKRNSSISSPARRASTPFAVSSTVSDDNETPWPAGADLAVPEVE